MNRLVSFIAAGFLIAGLTSCIPVVFENPVPAASRVLDQFPPELQGMYFSYDKEDTLIINADSYRNMEDSCF